MRWFGGSIAEAVNLSKQKNAIFVVFVEGDNDLSTEMTATLDDGEIMKRLSNESNFLVVKLKSGSTNYTHFAQIYQFVPVPSLFFIGRNGTPLEVVCAGVEADNLATRIDRILEEHHKGTPSPIQPSTSGSSVRHQTSNLLKAETASAAKGHPRSEDGEPSSGPAAKVAKCESTPPEPQFDVVCDGDVCVKKPRATHTDTPEPNLVAPAAPLADAEAEKLQKAQAEKIQAEAEKAEKTEAEKIQKAKELIEIRRREKAEQEKELERQKELERRSTGQGVAELKRWQADQEMKALQEERRREKMENSAARQRVLDQIAQDRAERRAREAPATPGPQAAPPQSCTLSPPADANSSVARIQFKLPDGSSHSAQFDADNELGRVHAYVADNLQLSSNDFTLWTAFPRRQLLDPSATLRELQLVPSAALLLLPRSSTTSVSRPSAFGAVIAYITQLIHSLRQQVYSWLWPAPQPPTSAPRASPPRPPAGSLRYRPPNVHRLAGDGNSDDDNNTWNGNSTQQM